MSRGGARNRSGPTPDPMSLKSMKLEVSLTALPSDGYRGEVPAFPLSDPSRRELEVWRAAWSTPQAAAWSTQSWRWDTVALWVRLKVRCEDPEAGAALLAQLHRFADQIGMTPAGLRENGWEIESPEQIGSLGQPQARPASRSEAIRARGLRVVNGG